MLDIVEVLGGSVSLMFLYANNQWRKFWKTKFTPINKVEHVPNVKINLPNY